MDYLNNVECNRSVWGGFVLIVHFALFMDRFDFE